MVVKLQLNVDISEIMSDNVAEVSARKKHNEMKDPIFVQKQNNSPSYYHHTNQTIIQTNDGNQQQHTYKFLGNPE